jgi:hypothetical protein
MAPPSQTLTAYAAVGNREDLSDVIYDISPLETPFLSAIPTVSVDAVLHEWQTHSLTAASEDNAVEEGLDAVTDASTTTTRLTNRTQISDKVARVTGTQEKVMKAGRKSELAFQITNRARELKRDMERSLLANKAKVTGASGTAPVLAGVLSWIATNESAAGSAPAGTGADTRTGGTQRAFTEAQLKAVLASAFDAGGDPDCILVNAFNKQAMSAFTGNATRMIGAGEEKLYASIDIYKSDFGELMVKPSRYLGSVTQQGDHALVLQTDMWAIGYLRQFQLHDLAKTGDSEQKQLLVEYTLESRNEAASGIVADLTVS